MDDPNATLGAESTPQTAPEVFGDYELLAEIARGGMGIVYRARQISLNRIVALKVIKTGDRADLEEVRRFRIEAEAAANLEHPHIVPVYDVGEHGGRHFFTMKLIKGGPLSTIFSDLRCNPKRTATLLAKVARAVQFAHQRGVLHRDLKPGNILIDQHGEPHVVDFGLAKRAGDQGATMSGEIVGTPAYMPPEQARAQKGLTTAVDVYSLGAILYECLTGRPPFVNENVFDLLQAVILEEPAKPSSVNAASDADLSVIALKCLSKYATRRYSSAAELADDLERRVRGEPILARPAGPIERVRRWCGRNRALAALGATMFAATVVSATLAVWALNNAHEADQQKKSADKALKNEEVQKKLADQRVDDFRMQKQKADAALAAEQKQRELSDLLVYRGNLSLAQSAWRENDAKLAYDYLDECHMDQRGWEFRHLWHLYHQLGKRTFQGHTTNVTR